MIAAFVILLREGVEASMIVAILLAYLNRTGHRRHFRDVFVGVGAALGLAVAGGVTAFLTIRTYAGSRVQTIFETATFLVAAAVLTYMTFWMRNHGRTLSGELRSRVEDVFGGRARTGLGLLAFQAVGREGLESVVFLLAIAFSASGGHVLMGGAAGLAVALSMAFFIYRLDHRLKLQRFFRVVGVLLMVFAAGLLVDAVQNMQQLGWISWMRRPVWDTGSWLSEDSAFGDVLHSFFGYAARPSLLQVAIYAFYVVAVVGLFLAGPRSRLLTEAGERRVPLQ